MSIDTNGMLKATIYTEMEELSTTIDKINEKEVYLTIREDQANYTGREENKDVYELNVWLDGDHVYKNYVEEIHEALKEVVELKDFEVHTYNEDGEHYLHKLIDGEIKTAVGEVVFKDFR